MKIIAIVSFWNLIKLLLISAFSGMSQSCIEGGSCSIGFWGTMYIIYPVFPYLLGGIILIGETIQKTNTKAISSALQASLYIYLGSSISCIVILQTIEADFTIRLVLSVAHLIMIAGAILFVWQKKKKKLRIS